ncbi:MAG: hypothetical protein ACP5SH_10770 [Syntrophobacteraceae bacterium]
MRTSHVQRGIIAFLLVSAFMTPTQVHAAHYGIEQKEAYSSCAPRSYSNLDLLTENLALLARSILEKNERLGVINALTAQKSPRYSSDETALLQVDQLLWVRDLIAIWRLNGTLSAMCLQQMQHSIKYCIGSNARVMRLDKAMLDSKDPNVRKQVEMELTDEKQLDKVMRRTLFEVEWALQNTPKQ